MSNLEDHVTKTTPGDADEKPLCSSTLSADNLNLSLRYTRAGKAI